MIKDIAIEKMKSASNYVITFLKWALISIIIGVVGGCVGALFHMSVNYANIIFTMHDWFVLFLPIGGIIIVAMYKACKMLENKGTDSIISSIRNDEKVPISLAPLIFVSTVGKFKDGFYLFYLRFFFQINDNPWLYGSHSRIPMSAIILIYSIIS